MSLVQKQISRAKHEADTSLTNARDLKDQWLAAIGANPKNLNQKEIDHLTRALKNRLLSVKWDCEDLEELIGGENGGIWARKNKQQAVGSDDLELFIDECKRELANSMAQLEDFEMKKKIFNKHGITASDLTTPLTQDLTHSSAETTTTNFITTSIIQNPLHNSPYYERIYNENIDSGFSGEPNRDELHFDKSQLESANATIFNNALYEHFETVDHLAKGLNGKKVFNNLTRPSSEVFTGSNENEMILEMLETEYYNPPMNLLAKTNYNTAIRNLFDTDRKRLLGTILFILSVPFLLIFLIFL